jgi:hypothetical protein
MITLFILFFRNTFQATAIKKAKLIAINNFFLIELTINYKIYNILKKYNEVFNSINTFKSVLVFLLALTFIKKALKCNNPNY